jgi:hypothetical protein
MGPRRGIRVGISIAVAVLLVPCLFLAPAQAAPQTISETCVQSGTSVFHNNAFPAQESQFSVSFAATPNEASIYGLVGFSLNAATTDDSLAAIVRFAKNGNIDVRNGNNFNANVTFPYKAGQQYQFQMVINPATKRYSVFVAAPGGTQVQLANNYELRSTLLNISSLNNWAAWASSGSESVCNMTIGSVTSATAVAPTITSQPLSQTIIAGQTATFSVVATGTSPLAYQWRKNGTAISGATAASYTTPAETTSDNGAQFTVVASNSAGSATSSAATLTVNAATVAPSITTQPLSQTIIAGQTATFSVTATGTAPLSYQWRQNGVAIGGASSSSYTTPAETTSANGTQFSVVVSNSAGSVTSAAATLTVNAATVAPSITTQPLSQTIIAGQTATFSVVAAGTSPLAYQWRKNGTAISGATASSYTTPAETTSDNGAQFTVVVSNSAGTVTSAAAILTVTAPGTLISSASTLAFASVNVGSSSILSATLTNSGSSSVTLSGVSISGPGFNASGISVGQIIPVGQTATLNVTFAPAATGSVTGSVTVTSNASNSPTIISLSGTGAAVLHSADLSWVASTSVVTGYNVYRSTVTAGPFTKLTSSLISALTYTDTSVQAGQTYYYVVTAVNSSNVESVYSNEVSATIP